MLQNTIYNKKPVSRDTQVPSYAVGTLSSQGKVKPMKTKSAVNIEKTIKVPSTSMYKDNKIYKCPVCKGRKISVKNFIFFSIGECLS